MDTRHHLVGNLYLNIAKVFSFYVGIDKQIFCSTSRSCVSQLFICKFGNAIIKHYESVVFFRRVAAVTCVFRYNLCSTNQLSPMTYLLIL